MKAHMSSGGRYPVLRSLGILTIITAALVAVAGVVSAIWLAVWVNDTFTGKLFAAAGAIAATFILCVWMLAFAETIKLFMDIEHNTRMAGSSAPAPAATGDGRTAVAATHTNRMSELEEETAEAALFRGH